MIKSINAKLEMIEEASRQNNAEVGVVTFEVECKKATTTIKRNLVLLPKGLCTQNDCDDVNDFALYISGKRILTMDFTTAFDKMTEDELDCELLLGRIDIKEII